MIADLQNKQAELIRKATGGSIFIAPGDADLLDEDLAVYTAGPPAVVDLKPLPTGYEDGGWFTTDGISIPREISNSNINSFGSVTPTRVDTTGDTETLTVAFQETNLITLGLSTGAELAAITAQANTGSVWIKKPLRSATRNYRVLGLFVDEVAEGEIWMGRYLPRAKVTSFSGENYTAGDEAVLRGVTFTGEPDSEYGSAGSWFFGGPGWKALLTKMGIPNA